MKDTLAALLAGILCGALFAAIRLPIPAPPAIAGVAGVVGVFAGFTIINHLISR